MGKNRIFSIDFTRGLVMIIMALDHVRDFMHINALSQSPTDLATTTPALFFTRWITYLCAPTFVFLAGTSSYLAFKNADTVSGMRRFLIKRGLWLILLEFTVVNFGLWFDVGFHNFIFLVIAAIGFGFVMLGLMLKLPSKSIGLIGLAIICCHNLFPLIPFADGSLIRTIATPFLGPTAFQLTPQTTFIMGYPPIPWLGIMLAGFALGQLFELPQDSRKRLFLKIGLGSLLLFTIMRFVNIYGDPVAWSAQKDGLFTLLSFVNVTKYPPSLLFCLITLGVMFLILAAVEQAKQRLGNMITVYGKVPLFYFLVHFYLIHTLLIIMLLWQGFHWQDLDFASGSFGRPKNAESGVGLWAVYMIWLAVVAILYPVCRWYGAYKSRHKGNVWLRYL